MSASAVFYLNVSSECRPIGLPTFKICSCNLNPVNPGPSENYHPQTNVSVIFLVAGCIVRQHIRKVAGFQGGQPGQAAAGCKAGWQTHFT